MWISGWRNRPVTRSSHAQSPKTAAVVSLSSVPFCVPGSEPQSKYQKHQCSLVHYDITLLSLILILQGDFNH